MPIRRRCFLLIGAAMCLVGSGLSAQERFRAIAQSAIAEVPGLRVITIRDAQLSECYTLFILQPSLAPETMPVTPSDAAPDPSIQRLREAAEKRERQLEDLQTRAGRRPASAFDPAEPARWYEAERRKIDEEYEAVLQAEIPSSYPWATNRPGMRSGAWEDPATVLRRGAIDPDPTSADRTLAEQFARLEALLRSSAEMPRLAASGPSKCATEKEPKAPPR